MNSGLSAYIAVCKRTTPIDILAKSMRSAPHQSPINWAVGLIPRR